MSPIALVFVLVIVPNFCQRPSFAGNRPIGYPVIEIGLADNEGLATLPAQLNSDQEYTKYLMSLQKENQPFLFQNKEHTADFIKNPQSYPQRPSGYNEYYRGVNK